MISEWYTKIRGVPILAVISYLGISFNSNDKNKNSKDKIRSHCILPDHKGDNKSGNVFCIDTTKNIWYCHADKVGGGNIELVKNIKGCTSIEAANFIAQNASIERFEEIKASSPEEKEAYRKKFDEQALVCEIHSIAAHHFHSQLTLELRKTLLIPQGAFDPKDTWNNLYETWGVTDDAIEENLIGFDDGISLLRLLKGKGYNDADILKSGLFYRKEDGTIGDSVFKNRLVFPYQETGQASNFIARSTSQTWPCYTDDPTETLKKSNFSYAKYKKLPLHDPKTRPYISETIKPQLFGLAELRRKKNGVVVEGITDVIMMREFFKFMINAGIKEASEWGAGSFLSNQISNSHIDRIANAAENMDTLLFLCDSEKSRRGIEGAKSTTLKLLEKHGILACIGEISLGDREKIDPAQWVKEQKAIIAETPEKVWEEFVKIVRSARNIIDMFIGEASDAINGCLENKAASSYMNKIKKRHTDKILNLIGRLPEIEREDYLSPLTKKPFCHKLTSLKKALKGKRESEETPDDKTKEKPFTEIRCRVGESFLVTDKGIFFEEVIENPFSEKPLIKYHHLCADPVIVQDRAHVEGEEECAYITLVWEDDLEEKHELIVPMDYLQAKNADKLCKRGARIISNRSAKAMSEYFEIATFDAPKRCIYKRLGWYKGQFVIPGIIDASQIFPDTLDLGYSVKEGDVQEGLECLKALSKVLEGGYFYPLLLHVLLAPASRLLHLEKFKYCLFLLGQTGNYKTALASHTMCIYGVPLARKFIRFQEGATDNAAIKNAAVVGQLPILIDNYKPNIGGGERKLVQIISSIVEGRDKLRLDRDGEFKKAPDLLCWPIVTGEAGIEKDTSSIARCIELEFIKADDGLKYLQKATEKIEHLPSIGYAWLDWLQGSEGRKCCKELKSCWNEVSQARHEEACNLTVQNFARVGANFACLDMALKLAMRFPLFSWLEKEQPLIQECLRDSMKKMAGTTRQAREGVRFLEVIRELLSSGQCVLGGYAQSFSGDKEKGKLIGWDIPDEQIVYLLPEVALHEVKRISEIMITKNSLYRQLEEEDAVARIGKEETTLIKKLGGKYNRVLAIKRDKIFIKDATP